MTGDALVEVLREAATAVRAALDTLDDWGLAGTRPGQYRSDLAADDAALAVLDKAGLGVLSECCTRNGPSIGWFRSAGRCFAAVSTPRSRCI